MVFLGTAATVMGLAMIITLVILPSVVGMGIIGTMASALLVAALLVVGLVGGLIYALSGLGRIV